MSKSSSTFIFEKMISSVRNAIGQFPDKRTGQHTRYQIMDGGMGAFSVFFTQSPSFLSHQTLMRQTQQMSNAGSLFKMRTIPTDTHIRNLLDEVEPRFLFPVFDVCFTALKESGRLDKFRVELDRKDLLIALDGTGYFSS